MSNSKFIEKCENCGEYFCMECSVSENWGVFCSEKCEIEFEKNENKKEE